MFNVFVLHLKWQLRSFTNKLQTNLVCVIQVTLQILIAPNLTLTAKLNTHCSYCSRLVWGVTIDTRQRPPDHKGVCLMNLLLKPLS